MELPPPGTWPTAVALTRPSPSIPPWGRNRCRLAWLSMGQLDHLRQWKRFVVISGSGIEAASDRPVGEYGVVPSGSFLMRSEGYDPDVLCAGTSQAGLLDDRAPELNVKKLDRRHSATAVRARPLRRGDRAIGHGQVLWRAVATAALTTAIVRLRSADTCRAESP